jgi:hypothetical protein
MAAVNGKRSSFVERMEFDEEDGASSWTSPNLIAATALISPVCPSLVAGYGTFMGGESPMPAVNAVPFHDTRRKWLMVAILSALTAINQGICYSYAPIASIVEARWQEHVRLSLLHST